MEGCVPVTSSTDQPHIPIVVVGNFIFRNLHIIAFHIVTLKTTMNELRIQIVEHFIIDNHIKKICNALGF